MSELVTLVAILGTGMIVLSIITTISDTFKKHNRTTELYTKEKWHNETLLKKLIKTENLIVKLNNELSKYDKKYKYIDTSIIMYTGAVATENALGMITETIYDGKIKGIGVVEK